MSFRVWSLFFRGCFVRLFVFFYFVASCPDESQTKDGTHEGTSARSKARKRSDDRAKIERKSTGNRPDTDPNRSRGPSGRSRAILGASGALPGGSGTRSGRLGTPPERPRRPPGRSQDAPGRPKGAAGRSRVDFLERSFRAVVCATRPERFSDVFGSLGGGPDVDSAAPCQCFVKVAPFSSGRPFDHEIARKWTGNGPQIVPKVASEGCSGPPGRAKRPARAQGIRFFFSQRVRRQFERRKAAPKRS